MLKLTERTPASRDFAFEVSRYNQIARPFALSIKSIEHLDVTAADVYVYWLAIATSLRNLFDKSPSETGIPLGLQQDITTIVNRRYKQFIDGGATDIYFTCFFLDPREFSSRTKFNKLIVVYGSRLCTL